MTDPNRPVAGAHAPARPAVFRYSLVDCDGRMVGGHVASRALHPEDVVETDGCDWRVVAVVGVMATVIPADHPEPLTPGG